MSSNTFACPRKLGAVLLLGALLSSSLLAAVNPYEPITARNAFGIKPPAPPAPPEPPKVAAPKIKLQGLTTILGRKQVIFKATLPAKPPEQPQPKEVSFMLSEGQRDGEIEVIAINENTGEVRFENYGVVQTLNMKDDADKPIAMAAPPPMSPPPGAAPAPTIPAPATVAPAAASGPATSIGAGQRTIPTRNVRSSSSEVSSSPQSSIPTLSAQSGVKRSVEENVALYEINRAANEKLIQSGAKIPRLPEHPLLKRARAGTDEQQSP